MEKIYNNNIKLFVSMANSYVRGMSEWFWGYVVSVGLLVLSALILVSSVLFGGSVLLNFYVELFAVLLAVHVYMSFRAIIHDYIYDRYVVRICTNLTLLIVLAVLVEVLKG